LDWGQHSRKGAKWERGEEGAGLNLHVAQRPLEVPEFVDSFPVVALEVVHRDPVWSGPLWSLPSDPPYPSLASAVH
jgi:hypothetical protein